MTGVLAFDTSNYTSSCAYFNGVDARSLTRLLDVPKNEMGLRQRDALFSHVKNLPQIFAELSYEGEILAVGASNAPREVLDSYMPCFLAGVSQAKILAKALKCAYHAFSHQQGHIAAAAWSAGRLDLLDRPHLAWHLSGGTTELLHILPNGRSVRCQKIGGSLDLSAGQLVDRTGKRLGMDFPAGRAISSVAEAAEKSLFYPVKVAGSYFSLSGLENQVEDLLKRGESAPTVACFVLCSIAVALEKSTENAKKLLGDLPILYAGGVTASTLLRRRLSGIFASPQYATDNALGTAILTYREVCR